MRFYRLAPVLASFLLIGCGKKADMVGKWNFPMPALPMQLEFKPDGTYSGTVMGGVASVTGTYKVEGKILALDPPQMSGAAGSLTPGGGQMRLEMKEAGPNAYALSAPNLNFTMSRLP